MLKRKITNDELGILTAGHTNEGIYVTGRFILNIYVQKTVESNRVFRPRIFMSKERMGVSCLYLLSMQMSNMIILKAWYYYVTMVNIKINYLFVSKLSY